MREAGALDRVLAGRLEVETQVAAALVRRGAVYVRGRRVTDPDRPLHPGDPVLVILEEGRRSVLAPEPELPPLLVLHRDRSLLAVDKPAGLPAQPTPGGATNLLGRVAAELGCTPGLVHRLDRETSGVTVFGLGGKATAALSAAFREGRVAKQYLAATGPGLPEAGVVDLALSRDPARPGRWRATARVQGPRAVTSFRRLGTGPGLALAILWPRTGRTHQLRAHLAALGAPLLGDVRYGGAREAGGEQVARCLLHAQALVLPHPETGEPVTVQASVPDDLGRLFARCGVAIPAVEQTGGG
jgi:23S rRNA pseudouridine1911/1915/1917 synthase